MKSYSKGIAIFCFLIAFGFSDAFSQEIREQITLKWTAVKVVDVRDGISIRSISFEGAIHNSLNSFAPLYHKVARLPLNAGNIDAVIASAKYQPLSSEESSIIENAAIPDSIIPEHSLGFERGVPVVDVQFVPLIRTANGEIQKLVSFELIITYAIAENASLKSQSYTMNSVLSTGNWYRIRSNKTGICKISYEDIRSMGVDMATVQPGKIRLFGKPGGMLPENNSIFRYDDLPENAIKVVTASAGVFAPGDYILFYSTSPNATVYNASTKRFEHRNNLYADYTYYFLNFDGADGKRIETENQSAEAVQYTCTSFMDFKYYEKDLYNLIKSGKQWVGERLEFNNASIDIPGFTFANVETTRQAFMRYRVLARATAMSTYSITANANSIVSKQIIPYTVDSFSQEVNEAKSFTPVEGTQAINFRYNTPTSTSQGYIDWVELNVPRKLLFTGGQLAFADPVTAIAGAVTQFKLAGAGSQVTIWEVTNPVDVKAVNASLMAGDTLSMVMATDSLRRFVAWNQSEFLTAEFVDKIANQNLHGIDHADMLIVTHPDFLEQANRLADQHRLVDGMTVVVATNQQIYNEFSSGSPDISAIRDFARMLYLRPEGDQKLKYLLLFGDGSYDYKDHQEQNTNFVLAFETNESQNLVFSTASDDFFGLLDSGEGNDASGKIDIGIGRFPVDNVEQAKDMVDKCIFYMSGAPANLGNWRNSLCFIADDEDSNTHIRQVEDQVTPNIVRDYKVYNINKVYLDAYNEVSTPSGARYPEVNTRINDLVNDGVLIMNYTGHGGETGWAAESILTLNDISSWTNTTKLPVFVTATCEFSRFDDPNRVSAGEMVFLKPSGGGVALFTTTRLANAGNNVELTIDLYDTIFSVTQGNNPRFGNIIAYAKNQNSGTGLIRNFMLIGDPAMCLAFPKYNVATTRINGKPVLEGIDTISAMSRVDVEGVIEDQSGNIVSGFNGIVDVKIYDKYRWMMTRGNDPTSYKRYFRVQENILYQGKATVSNGTFTYSFMVPRDIDFSFGTGKISYYAYSETTDATGFNDSIMIGGVSNEVTNDTQGPQITLYMNDERFVNGGITGDSPMLLAYLSDESGLNTVGNGIGHDIVATLDENSNSSMVLNEYYQSDLDSYRTGKLMYNLQGLTEGKHSLTLKAWDVFNNSSEATINFEVRKNLALRIMSLKAYPNPFSEKIYIELTQNLFNSELDASLSIYSINGNLIRNFDPLTEYAQGYAFVPLEWDGLDSNGNEVADGIYIVKVLITNGKSSDQKAITVIKVGP